MDMPLCLGKLDDVMLVEAQSLACAIEIQGSTFDRESHGVHLLEYFRVHPRRFPVKLKNDD